MTVFAPRLGDILYTSGSAPMGSKPIGSVVAINREAARFQLENRRTGETLWNRLSDVIVREHQGRSWVVDWKEEQ